MSKKKAPNTAIALKRCPDCGHAGEGALRRERISHRWVEGVEETRAYEAPVDAICCAKCGAQVLDEYARLQKHEVWCRENGLLGPARIRRIRRRLGLSITQFAELLGTGSASVGRWERGVTVQNVGYDNLIRLLRRKSNVAELARRAGIAIPVVAATRLVAADGTAGPWQPRFRALEITPELRARASSFRPRVGVA